MLIIHALHQVYALGKVIFNGERTLSALGAALFAVHPIHTDAVVSVRNSPLNASCRS